MRYLTTLAVSAVVILAVPACGSFAAPRATSSIPLPSPARQASSPQANLPEQRPDAAVTGTITWPDGNLAANTQVLWYLGGYKPDRARELAEAHIPADGSYSLTGCPCSALTGYLHVPPPSLAWPADKIPDCWIILQADGIYSGITADPGDVINWRALDMPCAPAPYRSDPSDVQWEIRLLNAEISTLPYGLTATGGSWQDAENRTTGSFIQGLTSHARADGLPSAVRVEKRAYGGLGSRIQPPASQTLVMSGSPTLGAKIAVG